MKGNVPKLWMTASLLVLLAAPALAQETPPAAQAPAAPATATPPPADVTAQQGTAATTPPAAAPAPAGQTPAVTPTPDAAAPATPPAADAAATPEPAPSPEVLDITKKETAATECLLSASEITTLREPQFGADSSWDVVYAEDGMDVFNDAVPLDNNMIVAVGSYTKDKDDTIYHPLLVKYDDRMKPVWTVREETKDMRTIARVIQTKDGFTVLGDIGNANKGGGIYIGSYDKNGKVRGKPVPIYESGGDLDSKAFVAAGDGSGYLIAAQYIANDDQENQYGLLYKVSKSGKMLWKRSFKTGRSTVFNNVQTALDGKSYIVTGQVVMDGNISGGWLLRVDDNGAVQWQRTYPRGIAATLQSAAQTKEGDLIVTGKARPTNYAGQGLAAWVMKTDSTGNPIWQRYFKGEYSYEAPDLIVYEDGRASVLINAGGQDSNHRSHERIITFSPMGRIQHREDFTEGQNSSAHRLVAGMDGERIAVGYAQTSFGDKQEGNEASAAPVYTYDGWMIAAPPLELYDDPCAAAPKISPILD